MTVAPGQAYRGFEQGPIRPPSEAYSLLIRVTRNCPWNRCTFCPVYKGTRFSLRPVAEVKRDIDAVHRYVQALQQAEDAARRARRRDLLSETPDAGSGEARALAAAYHWLRAGMKSVFLQDANSLVVKPRDLVEILSHLMKCFPSVERVTSYARAQTLAQRRLEDLRAIRAAGLDRLHLGFESGADEVLARVQKGCTKQMQIEAGLKAKSAGFEVSEYFMPGLGGAELSELHARESADVLNQVDPDFIRLRTLAVPEGIPLCDDLHAGTFRKCTDAAVVRELVTFLEQLDGIRSVLLSDHILNLFEDLQGRLPEDKEAMLSILHRFLGLEPRERMLYQVGRRLGVFLGLGHLEDAGRRAAVARTCDEMGITPENVDDFTDEIARRFL